MWEKLKQIFDSGLDKAVVIEDGSPKYVILSVEEYLKLKQGAPAQSPFQTSNIPTSPLQSPASAQPQNLRSYSNNFADNDSIFRGAMDPSDSQAPVDLSDIDTAGFPELADYLEQSRGVNLDDLPI